MSSAELEDDVFSGKMDWSLWRRIFGFAVPHRGKIFSVIGLGLTIALFDIAIIKLNGAIVDSVTRDGTPATRMFAYYCALAVAFAVCIWGFIRLTGRITCDVSYDIRKAAFAHLQRLSFSFYDKKAVGWLMARMTGDVSTLSRVMSWAILDICWGVACIVFISAAMLLTNLRLGLIVLLIVPVSAVVAMWFQKRMLAVSRTQRKLNSQMTATYNEGLLGLRTTRSMNREARNLEEFTGLAGRMYEQAMKNMLYNALFIPLLTSICFVGVALTLYFGGIDVARGTGFTLGQLVTFIQWSTFLQWPVMQLAMQVTAVQSAQASAERVQSLLDTKPEIADSAEVVRGFPVVVRTTGELGGEGGGGGWEGGGRRRRGSAVSADHADRV